MKIKTIFDSGEKITIEEYIKRKGVEDVDKFLQFKTKEDSSKYKDIDYAVETIDKWVEYNNGKPIYILVDCDVDGYFSASMLYLFLKEYYNDCNIKLMPVFHDKNSKAHGLNDREVFDKLKKVEPSLLLAPDSTTNDIYESMVLKELGWDIIVIDHHEVNVKDYSIGQHHECKILISNQIGGVKNKNGSGGLVTWHLCNYMDSQLAKKFLSYVMVSLIGDSMDMKSYENATFCKYGKMKIHPYIKPFLDEFNKGDSNLDYSFGIVSKCNATIRVGDILSKKLVFGSLVGLRDANDAIKEMNKNYNKQKTMREKLTVQLEENAITYDNFVIAKTTESSPLNGLVANKILGATNKTTFVVREHNGICSGSVRSNCEELKDILNNSGLFMFNEGHGNVFGTGFLAENEEEIIELLNRTDLPEPYTEVFGSYTCKTIPNELYSLKSDNINVFGKGLEEPSVHINLTIKGKDLKELGANKTTLKLSKDGVDIMFFFMSKEKKEELKVGKNRAFNIDIVGKTDYNEFRGNKTKQIIVDKYEINEIEMEDF